MSDFSKSISYGSVSTIVIVTGPSYSLIVVLYVTLYVTSSFEEVISSVSAVLEISGSEISASTLS